MRRTGLIGAAVACVALAAGLFLLTADVARWQDRLPADDVRYRATPARADLWRPQALVPGGLAADLLAVEDDVAFREAVRAVRLSRLHDATVSDPRVALLRTDAQGRLETIVAAGGDPARRSRAANLLGVLNLARLAVETRDPVGVLQNAVASFEDAITLDPENDEAKYNLQLTFQRGRAMQLEEARGGRNATPGGRGASGAGAGEAGSGY